MEEENDQRRAKKQQNSESKALLEKETNERQMRAFSSKEKEKVIQKLEEFRVFFDNREWRNRNNKL